MNEKKLVKILHKKSVVSIILFIISIRIFTPATNWYISMLAKCFEKEYRVLEIHNLFDCFNAINSNKNIGLIYVIIACISIFIVYNIYFTRKQMKVEKEGIRFKEKNGTYGTANFTTPQEIDILKIGDEENTPGIVLGETLDTGETIILPDSCKSINRNVMIWGASRFRQVNQLYYSKCFENCRARKR